MAQRRGARGRQAAGLLRVLVSDPVRLRVRPRAVMTMRWRERSKRRTRTLEWPQTVGCDLCYPTLPGGGSSNGPGPGRAGGGRPLSFSNIFLANKIPNAEPTVGHILVDPNPSQPLKKTWGKRGGGAGKRNARVPFPPLTPDSGRGGIVFRTADPRASTDRLIPHGSALTDTATCVSASRPWVEAGEGRAPRQGQGSE